MKKTALVIMAAGIGSRFGKGIKQLEPVGPNGEIIMDYSIYDALRAGFGKVVFVIKHAIEEPFKVLAFDINNNISRKIMPYAKPHRLPFKMHFLKYLTVSFQMQPILPCRLSRRARF